MAGQRMCYITWKFLLAKIIPDVYGRSWTSRRNTFINALRQIHALKHVFIPQNILHRHLLRCTLTQTRRTSSPPPSFHPKTLTCPLHLSIIQSVIPGVNHLPQWPAITACSQSEHRRPCCSPAWTPHLNHNALGLPPTFLQPPSFYLSLSIHNTRIYGLKQIHHSRVRRVPSPSFSTPPSLFRLLSNYSWYLAWVTVFNNVFKNKRALLKGWRGREAAKRPAFRAARWGRVFVWRVLIRGRKWVMLAWMYN